MDQETINFTKSNKNSTKKYRNSKIVEVRQVTNRIRS